LYQKHEPEKVIIFWLCRHSNSFFWFHTSSQCGLSRRIIPSKSGTLPEVEPQVVHPKRGVYRQKGRSLATCPTGLEASLWLLTRECRLMVCTAPECNAGGSHYGQRALSTSLHATSHHPTPSPRWGATAARGWTVKWSPAFRHITISAKNSSRERTSLPTTKKTRPTAASKG
jgi:hypothetical protein